MNYYLDITLLPDSDVNLGFLWQKVYQQVHIALVDNKVDKNESVIAVSFPRYAEQAFPLGDQLRLLANEESQLTKLNIAKWLNRLEDYTHIKSIKPVPENVSHVCFIRQQVKGLIGVEKKMQAKAEYLSSKFDKPINECLKSLEKSKPKANRDEAKLPFIWLESQETKQRNLGGSQKFPLFIKRVEVVDRQVGVFNCYGLSANDNKAGLFASIPQF
ncbi:type I-F CRISPR-associated endoribonuclease Cas6/Csy4 [Vibrio sp. 10N.286.49.B3]|uniref:type I-F CRISPR-associated endoribonuclease Cas6/Csy4 n=1 Tax=Vibrio sp. 10N.286.49.B3 TaxID=1880855 RepID=UPI000C8491FA|nr:type I-F CRISPR-associated endoribonuclease Cas6/Csy4 [Vibrio sp. 10N.286.49.B3]PMH37116.1 type I-F CRISPR-associated endoribonuclease Cas6/Csy4 [Vibrio sp. 10N.286.49.B3]